MIPIKRKGPVYVQLSKRYPPTPDAKSIPVAPAAVKVPITEPLVFGGAFCPIRAIDDMIQAPSPNPSIIAAANIVSPKGSEIVPIKV